MALVIGIWSIHGGLIADLTGREPDMAGATVGALLIGVVTVTSLRSVRTRLALRGARRRRHTVHDQGSRRRLRTARLCGRRNASRRRRALRRLHARHHPRSQGAVRGGRRSLTWADAFATTACALGPGGLDWVSQFDGYRALAVTRDGTLVNTRAA